MPGGALADDGPGGLIRQWRLRAGQSQRELAGRAEVSLGMLRDLEQGRTRSPHPRLIARVAAALLLDRDQLAALSDAVAAPALDDPATASPHTAGSGLWMRILGTPAAWRDGARLPLGPPGQRAVLALLAVNAGRDVHRTELVDAIWGEQPPATAVNLIQAYVGRLRQVLDPQRPPRDPKGVLVSNGRSYRLQAGPDELDWLLFQQLTDRATAAVDPVVASNLFAHTLALWPAGGPLADVDILRSSTAVAGLNRAFTAAVTGFARTATAAGHPDRALGHLWRLTANDPLDENAHALLMTTLAAAGQQAAALRVFADIRDRLGNDLGVGVGPELTAAHLRVLHSDGGGRPAGGAPVPRQLPPGVAGFVGRGPELAALSGLIDATGTTGPGGGTVVVSAIHGAAGIGKTALALHWAHTVADRFPDGQLYVDLRGFDPAASPVSSAEAIRGFLDALAVPRERVPAGLAAQAGLYRSLIADRRMLVILDNARDSHQVRPLLPARSTCLVVVTSRRQLTSLTATEGAHLVAVDLLKPVESRELLVRRLGAGRVAAEEDAADELVAYCAGLPLAISIAAARCAARPGLPIAAFVAQLRDARHRLDTLSGENTADDLRTVFGESYDQLTPPAARMFRLLGLYAGPHVTRPVAASLAALPRAAAARALTELADAHLLDEREPGRYSMHDLLRTYAGELAAHYDTDTERRDATDRTFRHYLHALDAADRLRYPAYRPLRSLTPDPDLQPEEFTDADRALDWCQAERPVLAALFGRAAEAGPAAYTAEFWGTLWLYFHLWSHWHDLGEARRVVLTAMRLIDTETRPAPAVGPPSPTEIRDRYRRLVELGQERGERTAAVYCLFGLTQMLTRQGRHTEALAFAEYALGWFRSIDDRAGAALALNQIGRYQLRLGRPGSAVTYCEQALALCRELGDRIGEAAAIAALGQAAHQCGDYARAAECGSRAIVIYDEIGDRDGRTDALIHLGEAQSATGDTAGARDSWREALAVLDGTDHPHAGMVRDRLRAMAGYGNQGQ